MNRQQRRATSKGQNAPAVNQPGGAQRLSAAATNALVLANQRFNAGDLAGAELLFREVAAAYPGNADALQCLAVVANEKGDFETAALCLQKVAALQPQSAEAQYRLGLALQNLARLDEAARCYRTATKLKPGYPEAHCNLGVVLFEHGEHAAAAVEYARAISARPGFGEALYNYANCLLRLGRPEEAIAAYRQAVGAGLSANRTAHAYANEGDAHYRLGSIDGAVESYERSLALRPDYDQAQGSLLFCLNSSPDHGPDVVLARALEMAKLQQAYPSLAAVEPLAAKEKLRIGYVSADLGSHPVGYFMEQVLENHDKSQVEVFCYSNKKDKQRVLGRGGMSSDDWRSVPAMVQTNDEVTARLRAASDQWREIFGLTDDAAAKLIADDKIDVLIDLSGHTLGARHGVFARRPAPVQATWLGYSGTTGQPGIEYILADRFVIPAGNERFYSEKPVRLPDSYLCFTPPQIDVSPAQLPAAEKGVFTFGSLNNVAKITPDVVRVWASIVNQMPGSRLLLQWRTLSDPATRKRFADAFAKEGLGEDRLMLLDNSSRAGLLARYQDIDLALDPFPYNGTTTTAEALWMGVPVLTVVGDKFLARVGESFLSTVGLRDELVTHSLDEYVDTAVALANDLPRLQQLRHGLRERMLSSPLCDGPRFARSLEAAFRGMWEEWCERSSARAAA